MAQAQAIIEETSQAGACGGNEVKQIEPITHKTGQQPNHRHTDNDTQIPGAAQLPQPPTFSPSLGQLQTDGPFHGKDDVIAQGPDHNPDHQQGNFWREISQTQGTGSGGHHGQGGNAGLAQAHQKNPHHHENEKAGQLAGKLEPATIGGCKTVSIGQIVVQSGHENSTGGPKEHGGQHKAPEVAGYLSQGVHCCLSTPEKSGSFGFDKT